MEQADVQARLEALYTDWRAALRLTENEADCLGSPLLLHVTEAYCSAKRRVLLLGQETYGWCWDSKLQDKTDHPKWTYPHPWKFQDIYSCSDFRTNADSIEALCWGYREFGFGAHQRELGRTPFWKAFKEVQNWPDASMMWGNVVRMEYSPSDREHTGLSIWHAPECLRNSLLSQQAGLVRGEFAILDPHICLFFTGPRYDGFVKTIFPDCQFETCGDAPVRELARLVHPALPRASFAPTTQGF
jgi:hypothetical protein